MPGFLEKILTTTRQDLDKRKKTVSRDDLMAAAKSAASPGRAGSFRGALAAAGLSIIAEIKRASPSKGDIRPDLRVAEIARAYERGGARAVSVLTEERFFRGSLDDLKEARNSCGLPILRKDFIIDPYQVWEAAAAGADAVLLIVAALPAGELASLMREADAAGLDTLVEVHTKEELQTALAAGAPVIGINNRDLATFKTSLKITLDMIQSFPNGTLKVSESGIRDRDDIRRLKEAGVDAILIGETLMRSSHPEDKLKELLF